jgi:hypothetical protein
MIVIKQDRRDDTLFLIGLISEALPALAWLAGKTPMQVERYPSTPRSRAAFSEPSP